MITDHFFSCIALLAHAQFKLWCCKMLFLRVIFSIRMMFQTTFLGRYIITNPVCTCSIPVSFTSINSLKKLKWCPTHLTNFYHSKLHLIHLCIALHFIGFQMHTRASLRTADVFLVVTSLPLKGENRRLEIRLLFAGYTYARWMQKP